MATQGQIQIIIKAEPYRFTTSLHHQPCSCGLPLYRTRGAFSIQASPAPVIPTLGSRFLPSYTVRHSVTLKYPAVDGRKSPQPRRLLAVRMVLLVQVRRALSQGHHGLKRVLEGLPGGWDLRLHDLEV